MVVGMEEEGGEGGVAASRVAWAVGEGSAVEESGSGGVSVTVIWAGGSEVGEGADAEAEGTLSSPDSEICEICSASSAAWRASSLALGGFASSSAAAYASALCICSCRLPPLLAIMRAACRFQSLRRRARNLVAVPTSSCCFSIHGGTMSCFWMILFMKYSVVSRNGLLAL